MSEGMLPDATPAGFYRVDRIDWSSKDARVMLQVLWYSNGEIRFRHLCDRTSSDRGVIICAPLLQIEEGQHRVVQVNPITVEPSVLCSDCGTHGFITNGRWVPA